MRLLLTSLVVLPLCGWFLYRIGAPSGDDITWAFLMSVIIPPGLPVWALVVFWKQLFVLLVTSILLTAASNADNC